MKRSIGVKCKTRSYAPGKRSRASMLGRFEGVASSATSCENNSCIGEDVSCDIASAVSYTTVSSEQPKQRRDKPTHNELMEEQALDWLNLHDSAFETFVQQQVAISNNCVVCNCITDFPIRCVECGPFRQYCIDCEAKVHLYLLHRPEIWKEKAFVPYVNPIIRQWRRQDHECIHCEARIMRLVDDKGRLHTVNVMFCQETPDICTLLQFQFWGASARRPTIAFSSALLDLLQSLTLECAVSVKGFVNTLQWKNNLSATETRLIYNALIGDSMSSYRALQHRLNNFSSCKARLENSGIRCPSCPKEGGTLLLAMDGHFGLVRKCNSGKSYVEPSTNKSGFFVSTEEVDNFVNSYQSDGSVDKSCSNFLAGNAVRSRARNAKLDVRGVFGSVCRHEMPVLFMDMKHGERFAYPVLMTKEILKAVKVDCRLLVSYDIGCNLQRHLEKSEIERQLLTRVTFGVPAFHAYGHKSSCQVKYNVRRLAGFGLMEGEGTERLWSYLRPLGKITKEMAPSRRTDLLNMALGHYYKRKIAGLPLWIDRRFDRVQSVLNTENRRLQDILDDINSSTSCSSAVDVGDVRQWHCEQLNQFTKTSNEFDDTVSAWERKYVLLLQSYYSLRQEAEKATDPDLARVALKKATEVSIELTAFETKHHITDRWIQTHSQFVKVSTAAMEADLIKVLTRLHNNATNRCYLINLLPKYSDGQAMSTRLSKKVTKSTKDIEDDVLNYNSYDIPLHSRFPQKITGMEARNPDSEIYSMVKCIDNGTNSPIPMALKWKAIDHLLLIERATEEEQFVRSDLRLAMEHFSAYHYTIINIALSAECSPGETSLMFKQLYDMLPLMQQLWRIGAKRLGPVLPEPLLPDWLTAPLQLNYPELPGEQPDNTDIAAQDDANFYCQSSSEDDESDVDVDQ